MEDDTMTHIKLEDKKVYYVSVYYFDDDDTMVDVLDEIIELTDEDSDLKTISDIENVYRSRFPYDYIDIKGLTWTCDGIEFIKDLNLK